MNLPIMHVVKYLVLDLHASMPIRVYPNAVDFYSFAQKFKELVKC
jgi:hypothetical protein